MNKRPVALLVIAMAIIAGGLILEGRNVMIAFFLFRRSGLFPHFLTHN